MSIQDVASRYVTDHNAEIHAEIDRSRRSGEYIYILRHPETGLLKIGYTTNFRQRRMELNWQESTKLRFVALFPGSRKLERMLHNKFNYYRVTKRPHHLQDGPREWFQTSEELESLLASIRAR